ncbi:MAG: hypothetical protein FWE11_01995 [Defluviitaleaceae bacterium]|nr:hypothetical protein [Defluviitaleaceae bacterium]
MNRLFERHHIRDVVSLNGQWQFKTDSNKEGLAQKWHETFPKGSDKAIVPSCWTNQLGYFGYEGLAWYSREIITTSPNIKLDFHGITGQAEVYLDGRHLKSHYGSFTPFSVTITDLEPGSHVLTVSCDNTTNNIDTMPLLRVDWHNYGGITRGVELSQLPDLWVEDVEINYTLGVDADVIVKLNVSGNGCTQVKCFVDGTTVHTGHANPGEYCFSFTLSNIRLWDIHQPNLYTIRIELDSDDIVERIGFRTVETRGNDIFINGKKVFLKGVNRHEDHPDFGFALPLQIMQRDIHIIKDMGCNAIRGSHYPNAEAFLDFCDEHGLVFWEEVPLWQHDEAHITNPVLVNRTLDCITEMITRDRHHPSIIMWGVHNEINTTVPASVGFTKTLVDRVRNLDPTRLVTYASHMPMDDLCFSLVDVICVNKYYGWYEGDLGEWPIFLEKFKEKMKEEGVDNKPFIMSEFGAEGIHGLTTYEAEKWTENHQAQCLEYELKLFTKDPDISGTFIWQYCDTRASIDFNLGRGRSYNNKGVVSQYRSPKLAFSIVKDIYS